MTEIMLMDRDWSRERLEIRIWVVCLLVRSWRRVEDVTCQWEGHTAALDAAQICTRSAVMVKERKGMVRRFGVRSVDVDDDDGW